MFYTERLMLRSIDPEADKMVLMQFFNNEDETAAFLDAPRPMDRNSVTKFIEERTKPKDGLPYFVVCEKPEVMPESLEATDDLFMKDGKPRYPLIGIFSIFQIPSYSIANRVAKMGIMLDKAHRDKGLGTELITWGMDYAFFSLGLHKIELGTHATNIRAQRCYEKVGFVREGVQRSARFWRGKWEDLILMGLLEDEWRQIRQRQ